MASLRASWRTNTVPHKLVVATLASLLALQPSVLQAQDPNAPAKLEELIPDSAVENPEAWAENGADTATPPAAEEGEMSPGAAGTVVTGFSYCV